MMCFLPPTYTLEIPFLIVREQDLSYYPISKDDQGEDAEELGYWPPECFAHSSPKGRRSSDALVSQRSGKPICRSSVCRSFLELSKHRSDYAT
jgi:hypothetical protein